METSPGIARYTVEYIVDYDIPDLSQELKLPEEVEEKAVEILEAQDPQYLSAKKPLGLAAGALHTACKLMGNDTQQKAIARAAGVSDTTLRKHYVYMSKRVEI